MKPLLSTLIFAAFWALASAVTCTKKKLIIDSDFYNLPDDANAIGLANILGDWGEVELLGVISDIRSRFAPPAIDAINTYYGHPDVPLAILKPVDNSTQDPNFPTFAGWVDKLSEKFPEDVHDGTNTTDPVTLYRTLLAKAEDKSITIAVIGFFDAIYRFVDSPPDAISPLTGFELIKQKVLELVVQADGSGSSFNLAYHNGTFAAHVLNNWPSKLTFVPGYVGRTIRMGAKLAVELDPATNPISFVWNATIGPNKTDPAWDPSAVYYAIRGLDDVYHYNKSAGGVIVYSNGTSRWNASATPPETQNWVDLSISNVTFAQRLEDILLWEPGKVVPSSLARCPPSGGGSSNSTTTGTGMVPPAPTATIPSVQYTGSASTALPKSALLGAVVMAVAAFGM